MVARLAWWCECFGNVEMKSGNFGYDSLTTIFVLSEYISYRERIFINDIMEIAINKYWLQKRILVCVCVCVCIIYTHTDLGDVLLWPPGGGTVRRRQWASSVRSVFAAGRTSCCAARFSACGQRWRTCCPRSAEPTSRCRSFALEPRMDRG